MKKRISHLIERLNQKLESNIPEKYFISENQLFKTKLLLAASIITPVGWIVFAVSHFILGDFLGSMVLIVFAILTFLTIIIFKYTESLIISGNYLVALVYLMLNYFQIGLGVIGSPHATFLAMLPGFVYVFCNKRSFYVWLIVVTVTLLIHFVVLYLSSYPKLSFLSSMDKEALNVDSFTVQIGVYFMMTIMLYFIESTRENLYAKITEQKVKIETANSEITSSITYAKYIQSAILPGKEQLDSFLKDYFVLFKPRDIVSGDFYWVTKIENNTIIAAIDCTGHGVPGALMSMLGAAFLNETVNKEYITQPAVILSRLRKEVIRFLQQRGEAGEQKDGMDIALCSIDYEKMKLQFAGANNPLFLVRDFKGTELSFENKFTDDEYILYEVKGDKMPVGIHDRMENFTLHEMEIQKGDILYLFSDGFADQFGGPENKKLQYINFKKILLKHCTELMEEQKLNLTKALEDWQGNCDQIDDILVIGIKIT